LVAARSAARARCPARQYVVIATAAILRAPSPPLADQAVLVLRRLASLRRDARDVAPIGRRCRAALRPRGRPETA
jgi:hypothetical protein